MQQLTPFNPGYMRPNPEGWAAFGAVLGVIIGGAAGAIISIPFKPAEVVEAVAGDPSQAMAQADMQAKQLLETWARWRRTAHIISGIMATVGAATGAYIGAGPMQKKNAAIGAAIGTGAMRTLNVIFNPVIGLPGVVTGGVGAWVGATRQRGYAPQMAPQTYPAAA